MSARKQTSNSAKSAGGHSLATRPCSAVDTIRLQIARMETHAHPANVAPSKRQCAIMARQLTKALEEIETHFSDANKMAAPSLPLAPNERL
jgi:3-deoxy-D-manno-octulosonic acid (KDO) 8-phosphate synthase